MQTATTRTFMALLQSGRLLVANAKKRPLIVAISSDTPALIENDPLKPDTTGIAIALKCSPENAQKLIDLANAIANPPEESG